MSNKNSYQKILEICKIKNYTPLFDKEDYKNNAQILDFKCLNHDIVFKSYIELIRRKTNQCPKCKIWNVLTLKEVKRKIFEIHGNEVVLDEATYIDTHKRCYFFDKDFGKFESTVNRVIVQKSGHPNKKGQKIRKTCQKRYGIENPSQIPEVREKKSIQSRTPIEEIKLKIKEIHADNLTIDETTYLDTQTKARFVDKDFGEWWVAPYRVLSGHGIWARRYDVFQKTCKEKYGVNHPSKVASIAKKQAKNQNNSYVLYHWKTNEEVVCRGSYEKKVIEYLNKNQIDFDFQIPFDIPDGRRYFVDLYLKDQNLWIEVKGYKREKNMKKWDWFHSEYPNSELWDKQKLQQLGIL
mgnify:CR=1 FL=1